MHLVLREQLEMNQTFYKSLTPALIGAVTITTVSIPNNAQAGTVTANGNVTFNDVSVLLLDSSVRTQPT